MSKLTSSERNALPDSDFALPGRRFPVEDATHQNNALARATQGVKRGTLSEAYAARVRAKVAAKRGE